jgi:predicted lipoprotein
MTRCRRDFLRNSALISGSLLLFPSCRRERTKGEVLSELVLDVVTPDVRAALAASRKLRESLAAFANAPTLVTLHKGREACRDVLPAWKRTHCFRNGPTVETNALLRATFWPARPSAIEAAISGATPIDEALVELLGADAKGIYAVEYLLFPLELDDAGTLAAFDGASGEPRRKLLVALARNVEAHAENASRALGDGTAYAARFAAAGQQSVSRLVNQLVSTVENLAFSKLGLVLGLAESQLLKPAEVEGWPSGTSSQLALAELTGVERLYGASKRGGLGELVRAVAPVVDLRVEQRFLDALQALRQLNAPLERMVLSNRPALAAAAASTKALELALKVDVASALGVTLTFQTGDGD